MSRHTVKRKGDRMVEKIRFQWLPNSHGGDHYSPGLSQRQTNWLFSLNESFWSSTRWRSNGIGKPDDYDDSTKGGAATSHWCSLWYLGCYLPWIQFNECTRTPPSEWIAIHTMWAKGGNSPSLTKGILCAASTSRYTKAISCELWKIDLKEAERTNATKITAVYSMAADRAQSLKCWKLQNLHPPPL